jgi:hypothetical protein
VLNDPKFKQVSTYNASVGFRKNIAGAEALLFLPPIVLGRCVLRLANILSPATPMHAIDDKRWSQEPNGRD